MNIGIFTDSFTPEINGVVTSLQLFIAEFRRLGHEVFIFAPNNHLRTAHCAETNTRQYPAMLFWGKQVRLSLPIIRSGAVAPLNLDVIHVQTPGPIGLAGIRVARKLKIPAVYTYHTRVERYAQYYLHLPAWLEKSTLALVANRIYNKHDAIIAPSEGIKNGLRKYVTKPITVIPTGVDIAANRSAADRVDAAKVLRQFGLTMDHDFCITASRVGKEKNLRFIIDAFPAIKKQCPRAKLLIAGNGPDKKSLLAYARTVAAATDIIFLGFLSHAELFSLYRAAKVFLFASQTETQGMAIWEAMSLGLPVVAVSATGTDDLMAGDAGGFMVGNDPAEMARRASALIGDQNLWQTKSREAAIRAQDFSIDKMAEKIIALYRGLIK